MGMLRNTNFSHFSPLHILLLYILYYFNNSYAHMETINTSNKMHIPIPVRVVLDMNSSFGAMVNSCMDMAVSDFYSSHPYYETRLQLSKVLELVKGEEVAAILGTEESMRESFSAAVWESSSSVPILSFTARTSSSSSSSSSSFYNKRNLNSFIIRTAVDDAVQTEALTAICLRFGWSEAVIFYEDNESGNQFLSHTVKAFQDAGIKLTYMAAIPSSAESDDHIKRELDVIDARRTRVFLVHVSPELGSRLFALASDGGMMSEGYAWIVTDRMSVFLNSFASEARDPMDGVVGIRPYAFPSEGLKSFRRRWKGRDEGMDLNIYGLWAYDTVTALAIAVEKAKPLDSSFGSRLVSEVSRTKFGGLAGDFELVDGKLKASEYEIFNIIGNGERSVGFWSGERGITRGVRGETDSKSKNEELRKIVWPGDSTAQPKGWSIPPKGSLRVGVPCRTVFVEFVHFVNQTPATGFAVDIFLEAKKNLPFPVTYTFHCINDSTGGEGSSVFDDILQNNIKEFDMIVADTTIWAPRADFIDFSLPYTESGIVLVVKNRKPFDMWIFIRPLRWDLWLAIFVASILIGIVLCILENQRLGHIYLSPISVLAFQDRNMVSNKWSVFVLVCWLFMAFVLMQSFTANLSAILTLDQLKFSFSQDYYVGYQDGSFMRNFLKENLHINESSLKGYSSVEGFHEGMTKGSKNGGIDAIFDELPYMKLLLNRYKSQYKIVGPTYSTGGFGFAFPRESPLTEHFSRAILNVTQGPIMSYIERKNMGPGYSSQDPLSSVISQGTSSLTLEEFAGLFFLTGAFILFALFCSTTSIGQKLTRATQRFIQSCFGARPLTLHSRSFDGGGDGSSNENGNAPPSPPPGEGGGASVVGDEEAAEISAEYAAQNAGEGIELRHSTEYVNSS